MDFQRNAASATAFLLLVFVLAHLRSFTLAKPLSSTKETHAQHTDHKDCQISSSQEEQRKLMDYNLFELHETFYQLDSLRNASSEMSLEEFEKRNQGQVMVRQASLDITQKGAPCKEDGRLNGSDPCPVTWVMNVDLNRIPKVMLAAQCGTSCVCKSENNTLECTGIDYYVRVLRKTKNCIYMPVLEPISVGCACKVGKNRSENGLVKPNVKNGPQK